jgi:hypothetical protein
MSRTFHHGERRIRVRGIPKDPPDLRRVARALIALAQAQAEADAQQSTTTTSNRSAGTDAPDTAARPSRRRGNAA